MNERSIDDYLAMYRHDLSWLRRTAVNHYYSGNMEMWRSFKAEYREMRAEFLQYKKEVNR